jgi:hypothetical protein
MAKHVTRYFKLGKLASIFWDASAFNMKDKSRGLKVTRGDIAEFQGPLSKRTELALSAGHIVEVKAEDVKKVQDKLNKELEDGKKGQDIPSTNKGFNNMSVEELVEYYKENYEVTEEDVVKFAKKKPKKMVQFLEELEVDDES